MQDGRLSSVHIRRRLTKVLDQGGLQFHRLIKTFLGTARYSLVDKGCQRRIVAGDAQLFQVMQGAAHFFWTQAGDPHQLIGGDAFIRVRVDQGLGDGQQFVPIDVRHVSSFQLSARLLYRVHLQGRRKHLHPVFMPVQQSRLLQPGDSSSHASIVGGRVPLEYFFFVLYEYLARSGHDLTVQAILPVQVAQCAQHALDFPPGQS